MSDDGATETPPGDTLRADLGLDVDLGIDGIDEAALQKLLEEDPALEAELRAIEEAEAEADALHKANSGGAASSAPPPPPPPPVEGALGGGAALAPLPEADDEPDGPAPEHDDLDDYEVEEGGALSPYLDSDDEPLLPPDGDTELPPGPEALAPIPRINIHIFCSSSRTTAVMERAAADRRLAKAHVTLQTGDARRAAEVYAEQPTPNLLILEADGTPRSLIDGLERLAEVCDPSTRVIVVGEINDIQLYRALMERGVSDYVVKPRTPLQVISAISNLYVDPSAPAIGKSFVFLGARGGVGSSAVCHNVGWLLGEQYQSDTIILDFDLAFGTASLDFEHDPSQGLAEALAAPERLDDVLLDRLLQKCTDRVSLFAAPNILERDYDLPADSFGTVIDIVLKAAPSVVIDLPHLWSKWSRQVLQTADEIVLTATPDLSSFRNAKNIVETLKASRVNDAPPILVLNQTGVPKRPEVPAEQFEEALGIDVFATLPWDPVSFGTAATNAEPLSAVAPKSRGAQAMDRIAARLLGRERSSGGTASLNLKSLFARNR